MARLRSKGIQGQSANTTGAQLRARGGELIAGGIASAFGAVGGAVQNKKAREAAQAEAKKDRQLRRDLSSDADERSKLDRESREKIAGVKLIAAEQKASEGAADKEADRLRSLNLLLARMGEQGLGDDNPEVQKIRDDIKGAEFSQGALKIKMERTRARTQAAGMDPDRVSQSIDNVPELQARIAEFEEANQRAEEELSRARLVKPESNREAFALMMANRKLADAVSKRAGAIARMKAQVSGAQKQSVKTLARLRKEAEQEQDAVGFRGIAGDYVEEGFIAEAEALGLEDQIRDGLVGVTEATARMKAMRAMRKSKAEDEEKATKDAAADKADKTKRAARLKEETEAAQGYIEDSEFLDEEDLDPLMPLIKAQKYGEAYRALRALEKTRDDAENRTIPIGKGGVKGAIVKDEDNNESFDKERLGILSDAQIAADIADPNQKLGAVRDVLEEKYGVSKMSKDDKFDLAERLYEARPRSEQEWMKTLLETALGIKVGE